MYFIKAYPKYANAELYLSANGKFTKSHYKALKVPFEKAQELLNQLEEKYTTINFDYE